MYRLLLRTLFILATAHFTGRCSGQVGPDGAEAALDLASVEVQPEYPGGRSAMYDYLRDHLNYPSDAQDEGITGKVYVQFTIDKDGSVTDVRSIRQVHPSLDAEAVRAMKAMPLWTPATLDGRKVKCRFVLPVNFTIAPDELERIKAKKAGSK